MSSKQSSTTIALASFLAGSAVTAIIAKLCLSKRKGSSNEPSKKKSQGIIIPDEIRSEQLSRNELYFGPEGMESIKRANILIVGLGGVGSHTAHMLARAGVGYLRFVDFDQVTLSSLNRHACATLEDVGIPKVECLKKILYKICGNHCEIDTRMQMYTGDESKDCLLYTSPSPRDMRRSRMPSSA